MDELIGPDTVNTLPESTIAAFEDHGTLARTIDTGVEEAAEVMARLATVGVDMDDVGRTLEDEGVASFHTSFQELLAGLAAKAQSRNVVMDFRQEPDVARPSPEHEAQGSTRASAVRQQGRRGCPHAGTSAPVTLMSGAPGSLVGNVRT